jgi:hypothetical protein
MPAWARRTGGRGFHSGRRFRSCHAAADHGVGTARLEVVERRRGAVGQRRAGVDQAEQAAAFQVGPHHRSQGLGNDAFAGEFGNGDGQAVGAGAGDFDRELGAGGQGSQSQAGGDKQGVDFHGSNYSGLVPYGPVGDIQQTVKNIALLGLWQRAGLEDGAFNGGIQRGIP